MSFTNLKIKEMRKIMILSAAALAIFLAMPQFAEASTVKNATSTIQKTVKYQDISPASLPEAVTKSIVKDYAGFAIATASLGDDGSFKVAITNGETKNLVFYNEKGEFVKIEKTAPVKK